MLETTVQTGTNIVRVDYHGGLTVEDEQRLRDVLDAVIRDHGGARMLVTIGEIAVSAVQPRAVWMDLQAAGYLKRIDRLAVVTDASWTTKIFDWTGEHTHLAVRTFPAAQHETALAWITQP